MLDGIEVHRTAEWSGGCGRRTSAAHGLRHFKKVDRDLNPDMSFHFIEDDRDAYPLRLMCIVLEVFKNTGTQNYFLRLRTEHRSEVQILP